MVKTRQFVPVLLNDRLVTWIFEDGEPEITIRLTVHRRHLLGVTGTYTIEARDVTFVRKERTILFPLPICKETFYICKQNNVTFIDDTFLVMS